MGVLESAHVMIVVGVNWKGLRMEMQMLMMPKKKQWLKLLLLMLVFRLPAVVADADNEEEKDSQTPAPACASALLHCSCQSEYHCRSCDRTASCTRRVIHTRVIHRIRSANTDILRCDV